MGFVAVAVVVAVALLVARDDGSEGAAAMDPEISHVHGMGVNPSDSSLVLATHSGSFRLPPGSADAVRIGGSFQDTMGFTVIGPDWFLGSGHPDVPAMRAGQPTRLGLIESTDGGETWTIRSLDGEADFHALAFAHDTVYGWDASSGRFMVSADMQSWETRSTVDAVTFAVSPDDPEHIVAAVAGGLVESKDGGRSWAAPSGPAAVAMHWSAQIGLVAAGGDGVVWRWQDSDWQRIGKLDGEPAALTADGRALVAAVHDPASGMTVLTSDDGGRTWKNGYGRSQAS